VEGAIDLRPQRKVRTFKAHSNDNMEVDLQLLLYPFLIFGYERANFWRASREVNCQ
jgi:hypothetical protein